MMRFLLILSLALSGCSSGDEDQVTISQFSDDLVLVTRISASGGALGEEQYQVSYRYDGDERTFFEGVNPHGFELSKARDDVIRIKFCDGTVHLAQPVFLGPPRSELIHLELDLHCRSAQSNAPAEL